MKKLHVKNEGVIYRNPRPGYKAECAYIPNIVPLSGQELLCFYRLGQAFYSHDGVIAQARSRDGGLTWTRELPVWDPRNDTTSYNYSAPHGTLLSDGSLLLVAFRMDASDPEQELFNLKTGGLRVTEKVLFRSTDAGHCWSDPKVLDLPGTEPVDLPSQIIELNDGRLFLACEQWKAWGDARPLHIKGFALFSEDGGQTWSGRVDFPSAADDQKMYSHSRYTRMLDGRILALQWTQTIGGQEDFDLHLVVSDDTGLQWPAPLPTGIPAQTSWTADLGDGRVAAVYSRRQGMQPGVLAALSEDEGRTWDLENQVLVWDAVGQEFLGVEQVPDYPRSHENIAFGKPNLARLAEDTIIGAWWCTQACVTHIRYAIFSF